MNNSTWACFACRETVRRSAYRQAVVSCPRCGEVCRYLGDKVRTPPKRHARAWEKLLRDVQQRAVAAQETRFHHRLKESRRIRAKIALLEARGAENRGRAAEIASLRKYLLKL